LAWKSRGGGASWADGDAVLDVSVAAGNEDAVDDLAHEHAPLERVEVGPFRAQLGN
jgi:hypothetical protein